MDGDLERLTTALSGSDAPDVVEFGSTWAQGFEAAGAVVDLTEHPEELGATTSSEHPRGRHVRWQSPACRTTPAPASSCTARTCSRRRASGADHARGDARRGAQLKEDNADVPNFSGIYLPGRNWCAVMSFVWAHGGDIAPRTVTSGSAARLARVDRRPRVLQEGVRQASSAPADGDDANDWLAFCAGEVGMMPALGWKPGQIINPDDGCPEMKENIGVFAMPGLEAGTTAPVFLGDSNFGIPTNSEHLDLALDLLKIMVSTATRRSSPKPARSQHSSPSSRR